MAIIEGARSDPHEGPSAGLIVTDVTVTSAEILALFATPIELLAAPGANKAIILVGATIHKPAGTAYAGIAAGEDLAIKYTNAAGLQVGSCELTGFADSAGAETRWIQAYHAASLVSEIEPVANAALVAHILVAEIITGTSDFLFRIHHRIINTVLT